MARYSLCVGPYLPFTSLSESDRYPMGRVVSPTRFCSNTNPTRLSHACVSTVVSLVEFGKANTGAETYVTFDEFIAANCFSLYGLNFFGWFFHSFPFNGTASRARFGTNCQNTFHRPMKDLVSVVLDVFWSPRSRTVVWNAISTRLGRIMCPK